MDLFQKVYNFIKSSNLPMSYSIKNDVVSIDCRGWDIDEIDDMIKEIGGTREGFTVILIKEK
ncbi:MAG: hypothetical protein RIQ94_187 [Pseudomonadota bacterium]